MIICMEINEGINEGINERVNENVINDMEINEEGNNDDTIIKELLSDFFNRVFKYNNIIKKFLNPMILYIEDYVRIYLYLIYTFIIFIFVLSFINFVLIFRINSKINSITVNF